MTFKTLAISAAVAVTTLLALPAHAQFAKSEEAKRALQDGWPGTTKLYSAVVHGRMDKASAFLDNIVMPRAVMAVNGGALIAVPPNLFFCKDTDGDGKADVKDVVATDYGTFGGQPEHMANSPTWAIT